MLVDDSQFSNLVETVEDLYSRASVSTSLKILITCNQSTTENIYVLVGGLAFNPDIYINKSVRLQIAGFSQTPSDTLYVRLYDVASNSTVAELSTNSQTAIIINSSNLSLLSGQRLYEIHIKNGGGSSNEVKLISAAFDIY